MATNKKLQEKNKRAKAKRWVKKLRDAHKLNAWSEHIHQKLAK